MKKSLIALAALAATGAFAQSSVSIDGQFDNGFQAINYKGNKVTGFGGNGSTTSQINFRAVQDFQNGLKAEFRVETDWSTVSNNGNTGVKKADGTLAGASSFGNGEIRGGLVGGFGRVDFGAINNAGLDAFLTGQNFGTAVGSAFRGIFVTDALNPVNGSVVRFDNSARYITPSFEGFSASVLNVQKQTKANSSNFAGLGTYDYAGVNEFSLRYNNGPINAIFASTKQDAAGTQGGATGADLSTVANATTQTFGANYAMGDWKFFLLNQTAKNNLVAGGSSLDRTATTVSAAYTMGQNRFNVQVGGAKNNITGVKSDLVAFGYDYDLSKTTSLYARYESINDKAGIIPAASNGTDGTGTKRERTALGLRIGF
jgi:predicted porin